MTQLAAPGPLRRTSRLGPRHIARADVTAFVVVGTAAALAGYAVAGRLVFAAAVAAAAAAVYLLTHLEAASVLLGLSVPFAQNIAAGALGGLNLAGSDVFILIIVGGILAEGAVSRRLPALRVLRPLALPVGAYATVMITLLAFHSSLGSVLKTGQRFELYLFPLLAGAYFAQRGIHRVVFSAYVVSTTCVAAVYPFFVVGDQAFGLQKNPAGQFMGNAILLLVGMKSLRRLLWCMPVLVVSLLFTQSRGAILATGAGLLVLLLAQGARSPRVLVARVVPLALFLVAGFYISPQAIKDRNTTFKAGTGSAAAYAIHIRDLYHAQAQRVVRENPWVGVGVGQYRAGTVLGGDLNTDPHQVLLFQRAEGGPFLEGGFLLLVLGSVAVVAVRGRKTELGPAAIGVTVAVASHGLVDVYWVRATPVLGWLLVGAAAALALEGRGKPV